MLCQVEVRTTVRAYKQEGSVGLVMVQTCLEHEICLVQEVAVGTLSSFYPSLCVAAIVAFGTKLLTLHLLISGYTRIYNVTVRFHVFRVRDNQA